MIMRREGDTLLITDGGIYEPAPLPRDYGRPRRWSMAKRIFLVLAALALIGGALAGLAYV